MNRLDNRDEVSVTQEDITAGSRTAQEVASQPACWRHAARLATDVAGSLPTPGERVAVAGCGTSWFMAQSYAAAREQAGHGETDAFAASEMPAGRRYDRVLVLSRSGTTTEIVQLLREGVRVTVNSDDPAYFGGYVSENFDALAGAAALTPAELVQLARNSFEIAWLTSRSRDAYLAEVDAYAAAHGIDG